MFASSQVLFGNRSCQHPSQRVGRNGVDKKCKNHLKKYIIKANGKKMIINLVYGNIDIYDITSATHTLK